jgi:predicted nucleic acid-binding protein
VSYLLDTDVVSALRRKDRLAPGALKWLQAQLVDELHISALTMMEIEVGIQRLERRDAGQASMLRAWKDGLLRREFRGRILDVDLAICERCAALHVPNPRPGIDALIAATAIVGRLTLVTRNERDFEGMPVAIVNPWSAPARR